MIVRRPTFFSMREGNQGDDYLASIHMLKSQGISYDEIVDLNSTMKMGRGKMNPAGHGHVILLPGHQPVYDCIQLAAWIESQGLKRLA